MTYVILAALGLGSVFIYLIYRRIQKDAVSAAEAEQLMDDLKRHRKATEKHRERVKNIPKEIPSRIDPIDPWAGL